MVLTMSTQAVIRVRWMDGETEVYRDSSPPRHSKEMYLRTPGPSEFQTRIRSVAVLIPKMRSSSRGCC